MGLFGFFKRKFSKKKNELTIKNSDGQIVTKASTDLICLEKLPESYEMTNDLVEIKDKRILLRINNLVPTAGKASVSIGKVIEGATSGTQETLYRIVLKSGEETINSQALEYAKTGVIIVKDKAEETADLIPVKTTGNAVAVNAVSAVMGVASMIVGQYYIKQVDNKLIGIREGIDKISNFLDIQYKSQVASLLESVFNISKFQMSSVENEELRNQEIDNIQQLRDKCQELLNQSEFQVDTIISKKYVNFKSYVKAMTEVDKWYQYQLILAELLYQIDVLDYTLHEGIKSKEQCFGSFQIHYKKVDATHSKLVQWHEKQCVLLRINLDTARRKHTGFLKILEKPIGWINKKWNYVSVDADTINMIKNQMKDMSPLLHKEKDLFNKDVEIITKKGKYYYKP